MASTYSPLLRLELMANGEKSGQWGTITNTNLSTVLEQAVAGTTTINITGQTSPITLTVNDGASDQSRAGILLITGTNASNMNIVAPAVSKVYVVNNTSDRSVTIKTSSSTGVTVASGIKQIVAYNTSTSDFEAIAPSSNVTGTVTSVAINAGSTGLTFSGGPITSSGTFNVGGALAIANGGTGQTSQQGAINALLPSQAAQSGKFLTTDGTNVTWATAGGGGGIVTGVTASAPLASSGGNAPNISFTGLLPVANGGTNASTASAARTNLGLGTVATLNSVSLTSNISGTLGVGNGGTGVTTYSTGQLLIGNAAGTLTAARLTEGAGISITNGNGSITIGTSGGGGGRLASFANAPATALNIPNTSDTTYSFPAFTMPIGGTLVVTIFANYYNYSDSTTREVQVFVGVNINSVNYVFSTGQGYPILRLNSSGSNTTFRGITAGGTTRYTGCFECCSMVGQVANVSAGTAVTPFIVSRNATTNGTVFLEEAYYTAIVY